MLQSIITYIVKFLKTFVITFLVVYIVFCTILYFNQESLLYHPPNDDFNNCNTFSQNDTHTIGETRFYSDIILNESTTNKTILIYYHGNAESACDNSMWKDIALTNNMSFLIVEYPGYGADTRHTNKETILADADAIVKVLQNKSHIIIGRSVGNGPATYLASKTNPKRVVLISPYDKLQNVVWSKNIPGFLLKDDFEPIVYLRAYNGPVYVFAAEDDVVVPVKFSKRINATKFELVPNADHNTILSTNYENILSAILTN